VIFANSFDGKIEFLIWHERKRKSKTITITDPIILFAASLVSLILALLFGYLLIFILLANFSLTRCEKKRKEPERAVQ
jgi:hypothetical protein